MANSLDLRCINVSLTSDGTPLGILEIEPRWRSVPHTLWTRAQVRKASSTGGFSKHVADIPRAFRAYAEEEAKKRRSKTKHLLAQLIAEQSLPGRPKSTDRGEIPSQSPSADPLAPPKKLNELEERNFQQKEETDDIDADLEALIKSLRSVYR